MLLIAASPSVGNQVSALLFLCLVNKFLQLGLDLRE